MSQRDTLQIMLGATLALCATRPATFDAAGYQSTDLVFTTVGQVENFGNHGGTKNVSTFTPVGDGVVAKAGGSKDYGNMSLMLGCLPSDTGQGLIDSAFESTNRYSAKITYPLGDGEVTPEIHYLDVIVSKREWQDGAVNDFRKVAVDFAVCKAPVVVDAT